MKNKKVALIQGGMGAERDISLQTAAAMESSLKNLGYDYDCLEADKSLIQYLKASDYSCALLAVHGKFGEDGTLQGLLEFLKIPYSGSGVLASALCMDKPFCKAFLKSYGIRGAEGIEFIKGKDSFETIELPFAFPVVVKPSRDGSSVGTFICHSMEDLEIALRKAVKIDSKILVEEYIGGGELTVPYFLGKSLTPIGIEPLDGFYDYENKYTEGKTLHHLPAKVSDKVIEESQKITERIAQLLEIRTYARVDFLLTEDEELIFMEVNTLPGCTKLSLFPESAAYQGISFDEIVKALIETASLDYK